VLSDVVLVKAVLKGDRDAFCELVNRHERSVRAVCMSVLRDEHSARDAAQDAFIKAYEKLAKLKDAKLFGSWLVMIARRSALDTLKRKTKNKYVELNDNLQAKAADNQLDENKQELLKAVLRLPKPQQQVVMLRYFGGHSVKEVANISERSVGTVTKQLSRAHKHLKCIMKEL
jgi:RNA polymerase sigma-70 factor (ECF subfamily)